MKKVLFAFVLMTLAGATIHAQFGRILGNAVKDAAQNAAVRKAEQKTDEAVSKSIDKATDPNSYKGNGSNNNGTSNEGKNNQSGNGNNASSGANGAGGSQATPKALEATYAKSDFVPGDEIIFEDNMDNEQLGEFPSQWDLIAGNSEVVSAAGKKAFELSSYQDKIMPLMKNPKNFLGDVFTVEFDFLSMKSKSDHSLWPTIKFEKPNEQPSGYGLMSFSIAGVLSDERYNYRWETSASPGTGDGQFKMDFDTWHHFAISFNKRAWKLYIDGIRIVNVPNVVTPPGWFYIEMGNVGKDAGILFTNFRIAKGAVPLYDRLASEGKIITYGITFDVGKSTIKLESMSEINRIAQLMKDNPDLKFSVEGHTDNTGNAASNQTLSEARSKAIVDKLVEMGVSAGRLTSVGKGQTSPIADNSTDEGRAKNRRVEFVKI